MQLQAPAAGERIVSRTSADPTELIRRLEDRLSVAKPRDVLDARAMSECVGLTWRHFLATHIDPDPKFPIQKRGSEGVAWEFRVAKVLRHMIRRANQRIETNRKANRRQHQLSGAAMPDADNADMSIHDLNKLIDANVKVQKAKVEQGSYILRDEVDAFLIEYNSRVQAGILGASQKADPNGALPVETRLRMDEELRNLCVSLRADIEKWLRPRHEASLGGRTVRGR